MKNRIITTILVTLFASLIGCKKPGEKIISRFRNGAIEVEYLYPDTRDTSGFTYLEYYSNGKLHRRLEVNKNQVVSKVMTYYQSGKIYEVDSSNFPFELYSYNWSGKMTKYYETGLRNSEFNIMNGEVQGLTKIFDGQGLLLKQFYMIKDSIKDGPYTEFYPDGKIIVKATFQNDTLNGFMYFFNENGDTSKYYFYDKGRIAMPYKKWLSKDTILTGSFIDSMQSAALWKWLTKDGKEIKRKLVYSKNHNFPAPE